MLTGMTIALIAGIIVVMVGTLVLWSNPRRNVNRIVFTCSVHIALWLVCLHMALEAAPGQGLVWLRWSCAVSASVPIHFWIVLHGSVATQHFIPIGRFIRGNVLWIAATVF